MSDERKYSDGDIENKIARYLSEHDGNTTNIIQDLPEGTVFHNFTSARSNLISWYPFLSNDRVLEIGAGMGALTVQLAQNVQTGCCIGALYKSADYFFALSAIF